MPGPPGFWDKNNLKIGLKTAFCDALGIFTNFNCGSCAIFAEHGCLKQSCHTIFAERGCRWQSCRAIFAERVRVARQGGRARMPGRKFSKTDNLRGEVINILVHFSTV